MDERRLEVLLDGHFSDQLSEFERAELMTLLQDHPEARERLVSEAQFEAHLTQELGRDLPKIPTLQGARPRSKLLAAAAVVLVMAGIGLFMVESDPADGTILQFGNTTIRFSGEASYARLPASGNADGRVRLELSSGRATVEVPAGSRRVEIVTPLGVLRDVGTRFHVFIPPQAMASGKATLQVDEGEVLFDPVSAPGQVRRYGPQDGEIALSQDGFLGKVVDRQGIAQVRPKNRQRWSLARARMPLEPGDWIKTGTRGANAIHLKLDNGLAILLGPASLLQIDGSAALHLHRGEMEIIPPEGVAANIKGPDGSTRPISAQAIFRSEGRALTELKKAPRWLTGYRTNTEAESMGSLIAQVDGRNTPLTMGYHKVRVDIRDQIARTVVEESFINHTPTRLEGVFYFPLPSDASISGFAMWIGGEKVEGEIIEKQRAREIYETILRERRDPGLLEWSGGNIFKARVFPIIREKRIEITYTQVLPRVGSGYRYHYALQSDMLRLNPLSQLELSVKISSDAPLVSVSCPSHPCRIDNTAGSASIEFSAEEYTPIQDFEVRVGLKPSEQRVRVIPHRRGDDGYFMALFDAPDAPGVERRDLAPRSEPLKFVLLTDTSGSMRGPARQNMLGFVEAFLGNLGPEDQVRVLTVDTEVRSVFPRWMSCTPDFCERALRELELRLPLGWTSLEEALQQILVEADDRTRIIYVGDGVHTRGDLDPAGFLKRVRGHGIGTGELHTVAVSSSFEPQVMKGLARIGRGTFRTVGGGTDPASSSFELLKEITSPRVRDLACRFEGVHTAAVYPQDLDGLAAGTQAVIVGRFNPLAGNQGGSLIVSGTYGGKPLEARGTFDLVEADQGNSFIPRLWARQHLDHLLAQGAGTTIKDQVIRLSEDYQIITPYTSFLVLESDEDRERFKVKKRFRMRDGEEFFQEGRDGATFDLVRKQMQAARKWRAGLRKNVLAFLRDLGRGLMSGLDAGGNAAPRDVSRLAGVGGNFFYGSGSGRSGFDNSGWGQTHGAWNRNELDMKLGEDRIWQDERYELESRGKYTRDYDVSDLPMEEAFFKDEIMDSLGYRGRLSKKYNAPKSGAEAFQSSFGLRSNLSMFPMSRERFIRIDHGLSQLFPGISSAHLPKPAEGWPAEVRTLVEALNRRNLVKSFEGALTIRAVRQIDDHRGRKRIASDRRFLLSKDLWWIRSTVLEGDEVTHDYCTASERGSIRSSWLLGSGRKPEKDELLRYHTPIGLIFDDVSAHYRGYAPALGKPADGKVTLVLTRENHRVEFLVDSNRALLLAVTQWHKGEVTLSITYEQPVEIAGSWFPSLIIHKDWEGKEKSRELLEIEHVDEAERDRRFAVMLDIHSRTVMLDVNPRTLAEAKQAIHDGKGTFADHWRVIGHYAQAQRWDVAQRSITAASGLAEGKLGGTRLQLEILTRRRRWHEAHQLSREMVVSLVKAKRDADRAAAENLHQVLVNVYGQMGNLDSGMIAGSDALDLIRALRPIYARQKRPDPLLASDLQIHGALQRMGRERQALKVLRESVARYPHHLGLHRSLANTLLRQGDDQAALDHLMAAEKEHAPWTDSEVSQLRRARFQIMITAWRWKEAVLLCEEHLDDMSETDLGKYLFLLLGLQRDGDAEALVKSWLSSGCIDELKGPTRTRLGAAIRFAHGQGWNISRRSMEPMWAEPLTRVTRYFLGHEKHQWVCDRAYLHTPFMNSDAGQALRHEFFDLLQKEVESSPLRRSLYLVRILRGMSYQPEAGPEVWGQLFDKILDGVEKDGTVDTARLARSMVINYGSSGLKLRYWKHVIRIATQNNERAEARRMVFSTLLAQEWTPARQGEAQSLLAQLEGQLTEDEKANEVRRQRAQALALSRLVQWMTVARSRSEVSRLPDVGSLPRRVLKEKQAEALTSARRMALVELQRMLASGKRPALRPWLVAERLVLQVRLHEPAAATCAEALEELGTALRSPVVSDAGGSATLQEVLTGRFMSIAMWLIATEKVDPSHEEALAGMLDADESKDKPKISSRVWKYYLNVARDRGEVVTTLLRAWFGNGNRFEDLHWGHDLARVLAERNKIAEAIATLRKIEEFDALEPGDYERLATWHQALGDRKKHEAARLARLTTLPEYQLSRRAWQISASRRNANGGPAGAPDDDLPDIFRALFRKAERPGGYVSQLFSAWKETRDFRLLDCLADALVGQSMQRVYPVLWNLRHVPQNALQEAAVDRVVKHTKELLTGPVTVIDRRALHMLEMVFLARALDQAHGTEGHRRRVITALREGFKGEWADGEGVLMARFLAQGGFVKSPLVREEVLSQMRRLLGGTTAGERDNWEISGHLAEMLWKNESREEAARVLSAVIPAWRKANGGALPKSADVFLDAHIWRLKSLGWYQEAEGLIEVELAAATSSERRLHRMKMRYTLFVDALRANASVSLGRGQELYESARDLIQADLDKPFNESFAAEVVQILTRLWRNADKSSLRGVADDAREFMFRRLPRVLSLYNYRGGQRMISHLAGSVGRDIVGHRTILEFLVVRAENEPRWLAAAGKAFWSKFGGTLANSRRHAGMIGSELERRVLAIVLDALRTNLQSGANHYNGIYHKDNANFWRAKRGHFRRTALEVAAERAGDELLILRVSHYLFHGLGRGGDAIQILLECHARTGLRHAARLKLCEYLVWQKRASEALPHLSEMITSRPDDSPARRLQMVAFHQVGQKKDLDQAFKDACAWLRENESWRANLIRPLAKTCLDTQLFAEAEPLYDELIQLGVKAGQRAGYSRATLSEDYRHLSEARSRLGRTEDAVDAAAAAIVTWPGGHYRRQQALQVLVRVLGEAKDLDEYMAGLDRRVAENGRDSPVIRKALGRVLADRKLYARAAAQYRRALETAPDDVPTWKTLVSLLDKASQSVEATLALREAASVAARDPHLYRQLGERYLRGEDAPEAERAFTNMVEIMPHESDGHLQLAEVREKQSRWIDAAHHWREVMRIRSKEPTGHVRLAKILIRSGKLDEAQLVIDTLHRTTWPDRFNNVANEIRQIEELLRRAKK